LRVAFAAHDVRFRAHAAGDDAQFVSRLSNHAFVGDPHRCAEMVFAVDIVMVTAALTVLPVLRKSRWIEPVGRIHPNIAQIHRFEMHGIERFG